LLDLELTEKQQTQLKSLLKKDELTVKSVIEPYFDAKDPEQVIKIKRSINADIFGDDYDEAAMCFEKLSGFVFGSHSQKNEPTQANEVPALENDLSHLQSMRTIQEDSEENKSESEIFEGSLGSALLYSKFSKTRIGKSDLYPDSEQIFRLLDPSPTIDPSKVKHWLEESEKKYQSEVQPLPKETEAQRKNDPKFDYFQHDFEDEKEYEITYEEEETKQTFVQMKGKQLFVTPSGKKENVKYGLEAGENTHEKVNQLLLGSDDENDKHELAGIFGQS